MLPKKRVTLTKLISYVASFSEITPPPANLESVFLTSVKSDDEFKFTGLKFGESKSITDFPTKLKKIFDPYIKNPKRVGSRPNFDNIDPTINVTLYYSIANSLFDNFAKLQPLEQGTFITKIRDRLIMHMSNDDTLKKYQYDKLKWNKKDIINSLIKYKSNKVIIKLIADYFNINIFLLNIVEDRICVVSNNDSFDLFRLNIFVVFNEGCFESFIYGDKYCLDYNHELLKKLINVDKALISILNFNLMDSDTDLPFTIKPDNLARFKPVEKKPSISRKAEFLEMTDKDRSEDNPTNNYGEVYEEDVLATITLKISPKMKLEELQTVAGKYGISINKTQGSKVKPKTKNELILELEKAQR